MIRTLIVDDSAVVRAMLKQVMMSDERFLVVGLAENGEKAVLKARENDLDLIIMDYHMPVMDGLEATKEIFSRITNPPAVVMFSTEQDSAIKNACRRQGVLEYVEKPSLVSMTSEQLRSFCDSLADAVSKKHNYFMLRDTLNGLKNTASVITPSVPPSAQSAVLSGYDLVMVGASTGGPEALQTVIKLLGPRFPLPVLVTQHIDVQFDKQFALWLKNTTHCDVTLAEDGEILHGGHVYVAPADYHMHVMNDNGSYRVQLVKTPPVHFLRPAVDEMFLSGASVCQNRCISVLLTGMGRDGAAGMEALKKRGSVTICQNEESCVVFGMPKAAIDQGAATTVLPLSDIPMRIRQLIGFCG